jgi:hypothetical protein
MRALLDANRMPSPGNGVDREHMGAWMRDTRHNQRQNQRQDKRQHRKLKRQVAHNSYAVDPERVATAIIVKLAQEGDPFSPDPFADGPSRPVGRLGPFRQAA